MTSTMFDVSFGLATFLNDSAEFKTFCNDTIGKQFNYYVHVDMASVKEVKPPYFSFVTYTKSDRSGEDGEILIQMLTGIDREAPAETNGIVFEDSQHLLEQVTNKAMEIMLKELNVFGINGEKGFIKEYLNVYASPPMGEDDIQLQIDMILNTKKCL